MPAPSFRSYRLPAGILLLALLLALDNPAVAAKPNGLGDPGLLTRIRLEPNAAGNGIHIRGRDGRQQLFVTGIHATGQLRDTTRAVQYTSVPADLVQIDATGFLTPLRDGKTVVRAVASGNIADDIVVEITGFATDVPVNFPNQIIPIFTKLSCNGGGCHGKASGQNGFKLGLLGFFPEDDHEFLVKEGRGRRIFPASPSESLLLTKPTGKSPHGGGKRMEVDGYEYRILERWIAQGMPYGSSSDPVVIGIKCLPESRLMDSGSEQQITVLATYNDGSTEDVTRMSLFEANSSDMAEVSNTGLVKTLDLAGEVAIMARYQGQVSVFRSTIPLGAEITSRPVLQNFIDQAVVGKLDVLGIPASPACDDATFFRRAYIDITGTLPTESEASRFLADTYLEKRNKAIDTLVDSLAYADHFANKWNFLLRNKNKGNDQLATTYGFHRWIWSSLYENKPYDQFVRDILTASGDAETNPPVAWYREVSSANEQVEDVSQLFLGLRIQCARCHHHPFEKWSQDDYYGLAAFFSRVGKKNIIGGDLGKRDKRLFALDNQGPAKAKNERTGQMLAPVGLGGKPVTVTSDDDPRILLADWMVASENPFFAKSLVNRYWKHFFSRGIVEPEDDMRETNPPTNPELLNTLSQDFIAHKFDLKHLVRTICRSSTYQLSSLPNEFNVKDKQNFSRYYPKRLTAEVLYDAFHQVTATQQTFTGLPAGTRSMQIPDSAAAQSIYFLKVFGQPQGDTACECERSQEANLAQSLHLLNSSEVQSKIADNAGRSGLLANDKVRPTAAKLTELYRWAYSRLPDDGEMKIAMSHLEKHKDNTKSAYEDIIWALINSKEFLFNH